MHGRNGANTTGLHPDVGHPTAYRVQPNCYFYRYQCPRVLRRLFTVVLADPTRYLPPVRQVVRSSACASCSTTSWTSPERCPVRSGLLKTTTTRM